MNNSSKEKKNSIIGYNVLIAIGVIIMMSCALKMLVDEVTYRVEVFQKNSYEEKIATEISNVQEKILVLQTSLKRNLMTIDDSQTTTSPFQESLVKSKINSLENTLRSLSCQYFSKDNPQRKPSLLLFSATLSAMIVVIIVGLKRDEKLKKKNV